MSFDHLGLAKNDKVRQIIQKAGDGMFDEIILYTNSVQKINRKAKSQQRILVITDQAMYNFTPSAVKGRTFSLRGFFEAPHVSDAVRPKLTNSSSAHPPTATESDALFGVGQLKRRISIRKIHTISVSAIVHDIVIHVPEEYDYLYRVVRKKDIEQIVMVVQESASKLAPKHSIRCWLFELNSLTEISDNDKQRIQKNETTAQLMDRKLSDWQKHYKMKAYEAKKNSHHIVKAQQQKQEQQQQQQQHLQKQSQQQQHTANNGNSGYAPAHGHGYNNSVHMHGMRPNHPHPHHAAYNAAYHPPHAHAQNGHTVNRSMSRQQSFIAMQQQQQQHPAMMYNGFHPQAQPPHVQPAQLHHMQSHAQQPMYARNPSIMSHAHAHHAASAYHAPATSLAHVARMHSININPNANPAYAATTHMPRADTDNRKDKNERKKKKKKVRKSTTSSAGTTVRKQTDDTVVCKSTMSDDAYDESRSDGDDDSSTSSASDNDDEDSGSNGSSASPVRPTLHLQSSHTKLTPRSTPEHAPELNINAANLMMNAADSGVGVQRLQLEPKRSAKKLMQNSKFANNPFIQQMNGQQLQRTHAMNGVNGQQQQQQQQPLQLQQQSSESMASVPRGRHKHASTRSFGSSSSMKRIPSKPLPALSNQVSNNSYNNNSYSNNQNHQNHNYNHHTQPQSQQMNMDANENNGSDAMLVTNIHEAQNLAAHDKEQYLTDRAFWEIFRMTKGQFNALRPWKQNKLKRDCGLV
eukprot:CAMPEP_0202734132 /NCGR_PEP_ID=MMETSP1385-20130828/188520_1 /ASSEMBLY_ACC=CAM_ASM_000861 /TAXON_ID=933848 /ORGANISM="Elphidium margaritaceum" /LENGTH=746 /DNA_ID=CAMNT_0049400477 /DNA_START=21 /DNA_END=2261 /DNA_ORIENTATION=+